jgi:hypothetical protein
MRDFELWLKNGEAEGKSGNMQGWTHHLAAEASAGTIMIRPTAPSGKSMD